MRRQRFMVANDLRAQMRGCVKVGSDTLPHFSAAQDTVEVGAVVFDLHGTLTVRGTFHPDLPGLLAELSGRNLKLFILTADADGKAKEICADLKVIPTAIAGINPAREKAAFVEKLEVPFVYIGNGASDFEAAANAAVSFGIAGPEGINRLMLQMADLVFPSVENAIAALLNPRIFRSGCQL